MFDDNHPKYRYLQERIETMNKKLDDKIVTLEDIKELGKLVAKAVRLLDNEEWKDNYD